eukprot:jgi/Ulvmu1/9348/UM050_0100.1
MRWRYSQVQAPLRCRAAAKAFIADAAYSRACKRTQAVIRLCVSCCLPGQQSPRARGECCRSRCQHCTQACDPMTSPEMLLHANLLTTPHLQTLCIGYSGAGQRASMPHIERNVTELSSTKCWNTVASIAMYERHEPRSNALHKLKQNSFSITLRCPRNVLTLYSLVLLTTHSKLLHQHPGQA